MGVVCVVDGINRKPKGLHQNRRAELPFRSRKALPPIPPTLVSLLFNHPARLSLPFVRESPSDRDRDSIRRPDETLG